MVRSSDTNRTAWVAILLLAASCGEGREANRAEGQAALTPTAVADPRRDAERSIADPQAAIPGSGPRALDQTASATVAPGDGSPAPPPSAADGSPPPSAVKATRDVFGDTPDETGYYSKKLHFDLDSPDPIRRSQVLLEQDADGTLHLRFSKQDIDRMPRIDEVLPPVEGGPAEPAGPEPDPYLPRWRRVEYQADDEGLPTLERLAMDPPVAGYRLEISANGFTDQWKMKAFDTATNKRLWRLSYVTPPGSHARVRFSRDQPKRFVFTDPTRWMMLLDLDRGLVCRQPRGKVKGGSDIISPWPVFADGGSSVLFVVDRQLWSLSYDSCEPIPLVAAAPAPAPSTRMPHEAKIYFSPDRRQAWTETAEVQRTPQLPELVPPAQMVFRLLLNTTASDWSIGRTVFARLYNPQTDLGVSSSGGLDQPFLRIYLLTPRPRAIAGASDAGATATAVRPDLPHDPFYLVRNGSGQFFGFRATDRSERWVELDPDRGALLAGGRWWDLKPLAQPDADDTSSEER